MNHKGQMLQDPFLNALRKEHVAVSIYLVNGIKLQGQVDSFDQYVILLKNTVTQMVSSMPFQPSCQHAWWHLVLLKMPNNNRSIHVVL